MTGSNEIANGGGNNEELVFKIKDVVNGYKLVEKIDEGGFGQVFKVTKDDRTFYAMKLESNFQEGGSAIKLEINVLKQLPSDSVFPAFICGGKKTKFHYLVLELLGENLKMLRGRSRNPNRWPDGTWSRVAIQCLYAFVKTETVPLEVVESKKSDKLGKLKFHKSTPNTKSTKIPFTPTKNGSTFIEQEHSRQRTYLNPPSYSGRRRRMTEVYSFRIPRPHTDFRGTYQYASPNAHLQIELGRHDDLWSLLYMVAEFILELPWTSNDIIPVDELKNQATILRLFIDPKNPNRLTSSMIAKLTAIDEMLKSCNYYTSPNYELVYQFFKEVMDVSDTKWDHPFDWETTPEKSYEGQSRKIPLKKKSSELPKWEDPKNYFQINRWADLKTPLIAQTPPVSTKTRDPTRYKAGLKKKADRKKRSLRKVSMEESAQLGDDDTKDMKTSQKLPRKDDADSKKDKEKLY